MQNTICSSIELSGVGVHSGSPVSMRILPASSGTGIVLRRVDKSGVDIPALLSSVLSTDLCTIIGAPDDPTGDNYVMTIEHLLSAFVSLGVDNAIVEVDACEIPIMDGSSDIFVDSILSVGLLSQSTSRRYLNVVREFRYELNGSYAIFEPYNGTRFDIEIDFPSRLIGRQRYICDLTPESFTNQLSRCRTFGFLRDVEQYRSQGYALGSTLDNSVVIDESDSVMNPDGLRFSDEFVRHKALDAIGDLSLCGAPLLGSFSSYRGGHKLNVMALKALMESVDSWQWSDSTATPVGMETINDAVPMSLVAGK